MFQRWRAAGTLALVLFALNVAGRWTTKLLKAENQAALERKESIAGIVTIIVIGLLFVGMTIYWGRIRPFGRVAQDLAAAAVVGCLLAVFLGPMTVGRMNPFADGAGQFFAQIWTWGGLAVAGTLVGYMVLVAFTADYRSRQLKSFAERAKATPRRVVRR